MKSRLLITVMAAALLLSCSSTKDNNLAYFKNMPDAPSGTLPSTPGNYSLTIQPDDELVIAVTSAVPEATAIYNLPMDNPATRGAIRTSSQPRTQTYIVDEEGYVVMPVLGRLFVKGKTTAQIAHDISAMVSKDVKDPHVRVDIVNFSVDVMGEVQTPQRVHTGREHFTVLDAIASCGDLTEFAKRDRVYVIRDENGQRHYQRLDLSDSGIFANPYFYLKQNDIVYVEPNSIKIDNSKYNQNNAFKLSVISTVVSSASVIVSLIIALVAASK